MTSRTPEITNPTTLNESPQERAERREKLKDAVEANKSMSQQERSERAVGWMTQGLMSDAEKRGRPISQDEAHAKAAEIARRADHKRRVR